MIKQLFAPPEDIDTRARNAYWATLVLLVVLVLFDVYATYNLIKVGTSDRIFAAGISYGMTIAVLFGVWASRRGRGDLAGWLLIIGSLLSLFLSMFTRSGLGILYALVGIIITSAIASLTLSRRRVWGASAVSVAAGAIYILMDNLLPQRGTTSISPNFIYMMFTILVIGELLLVIRQAWGGITTNLRLKITVWTGAIVATLSIILVAYSTIMTRQSAIDSAQNEALSFASSQAYLVRADTEIPLDMARTLAQALTAVKHPSNDGLLTRSQVNAMLQQVLIENPSFLGTYTLWEPNAFDGQDALYKGTTAHDETGRFIPYWVRADDGSVNVIALVDYETPGIGDWYLLPRQTKTEVTIAPLFYSINGVETVMASFVVPILYEGKFYGIAGVDSPISFVQDIVDKVDLYGGKAESVLMTSDGTLIGVRNRPELVNQPATEIYPDFSELQARLEAGDSFISPSPDGQYLRVFAPVNLGKTGIHWSFSLLIPIGEITAPATRAAVTQGVVGVALILLALTILWFLSGQIVYPLRALTTAATAISQGNLNVKAEVQATDETGLLANAFNLMITQLRDSFARLEERVAERTRNLELAAEVGRTVSQVRALDVMLTDAAELIRKQFDLYYVQVYLTDPSQIYLNLQAGTGQVGEELLARNHRLPVDAASINGRAVVEGRTVVIADTAASATFKPNPLLPNTRSEMAVPLVLGNRVVGVLDMQSESPGSLSRDNLPAFEALAGQMAVAIQNAGLLAEAEDARKEVEIQARRLSRASWREYLDGIHKPEESGYVFEHNMISPLDQTDAPLTENALVAPIAVTGEPLGSLTVELKGQSSRTQAGDLVNMVARQVAQQIENLRLLDSAERYRAEAEQASRRLTHEGWQDYLSQNPTGSLGYLYDLKEVRPYNTEEVQLVDEATLQLPLKVRDETVGKLAVQGIDANNEEAVGLAAIVAERLGAHIEGLRLSQQTEQALASTKKQAQREQALRQITSAVRGSTDPSVILRTAARELGNILGRQTVVRMETSKPRELNDQNRSELDPPEATAPVQEA